MQRIKKKLATIEDHENIEVQQILQSLPTSVAEFYSLKQPFSRKNDFTKRKRTSIRNQLSEISSDKTLQDQQSFYSSHQILCQNNHQSQTKFSTEECNKNFNQQNDYFPKPIKARLYESNQHLKNLVKQQKIKAIVTNFIRKLNRNNIFGVPLEYITGDRPAEKFIYHEGLEVNHTVEILFFSINVILIFSLSLLYTISIVYPQIHVDGTLFEFQLFCTSFSFLDLIFNLFTVKYSSGKKLKILIDIWKYYFRGSLAIDLVTLIIFIINIAYPCEPLGYLRLIILFKIPQCLDKIEKLQVFFIKNFYNQQYWSLIKVFLFNFCFAHVLAISLSILPVLSKESNWMTVKRIESESWFVKYIWSYYWGTTIMLTVGFGDIVPTNYKEALCLIFIETFSCIALAYNINRVGNLINNIRQQDHDKSKKFKIFKKLTQTNFLPQQITWKINNYIEENSQLKKKFNFEEQKQFVLQLPVGLKKHYLKESNKRIFENLHLFKSFISKTLYNFAQKIEMHISHPEEIIQHIEDDYNLIILKEGQMGYMCKRPNFGINEKVIGEIKVKQYQNARLANLDFIVRKRSMVQIKSVEYSVFFFMKYDEFVNVLRLTELDFQLYCMLRDKMKNIPDEFEIYKCDFCPSNHLKTSCPRLHYIPIVEHVIHRHLHKLKSHKNLRMKFNRNKYLIIQAFQTYKARIKSECRSNQMVEQKRRIRVHEKQITNRTSVEDIINNQSLMLKQLKSMVFDYTVIAKEMIKNQLNSLRRNKQEQDEVWLLNSDLLCNFSGYFSQDNPISIENKYEYMNRKKRQISVLSSTHLNQKAKSLYKSDL